LDTLVVPVGGGGLIAGCATAAKGLRPGMRIVGVEPEAGDDTARSLATGERVRIDVPRTIADGLQATQPGELTFDVNAQLVDEIVTVADAEIVDAMAFLFDRLKLVTEPSGAVGVAALLADRVPGERIGVVISGGNVGAARFAELVGGTGGEGAARGEGGHRHDRRPPPARGGRPLTQHPPPPQPPPPPPEHPPPRGTPRPASASPTPP